MKDELFADLLASAEEMVRIEKGEETPEPEHVHTFSEIDVKAIREATGLRQQDFAVAVGVSYDRQKLGNQTPSAYRSTPKIAPAFASESFHYQSIENNLKTGGTFTSRFIYPSFVMPCARVTGTGSQARMESPPRSLVPSSNMPLWLSTIRCTIASPNPVPLIVRALSPRTNGWNRCLRCSGAIPGPSSSTRTRRDSAPFRC